MVEKIIAIVTAPGFFELVSQWLLALTTVVTAASAITALTPTKKDDRIRAAMLSILNFLALNVGNAARKDGDDA